MLRLDPRILQRYGESGHWWPTGNNCQAMGPKSPLRNRFGAYLFWNEMYFLMDCGFVKVSMGDLVLTLCFTCTGRDVPAYLDFQ